MASKKIKIVSALALVTALACLGLLAGRFIANRHGVHGKHGMVKLWEGGPYWATTNIGAERPWESGLYFWWGDTVGYKREGDAWVASDGSTRNFSFSEENTPTFGKSNLWREGWMHMVHVRREGHVSEMFVLAPEHDAAHVHWGGNWRMPTKQEMADLCDCDWTFTTMNGVNGFVIRGRGYYYSNSIFLPAAGSGDGTSLYGVDHLYGTPGAGKWGDYWLSERFSEDDEKSMYFYFDYGGNRYTSANKRYEGKPIRPVKGFAE